MLKTAAGFAAALKAAPATVAKGLLGSGLKAAASLHGLVAKLSPLLAGNKPLQVWGTMQHNSYVLAVRKCQQLHLHLTYEQRPQTSSAQPIRCPAHLGL